VSRWALTLVAGLVSMFAVVTVAAAGGGGTVSGAPELPIGVQTTGGASQVDTFQVYDGGWWKQLNVPGIEYWRVTLGTADRLVVDYGLITGSEVDLCVLKPGVTDYTLSDASCVETDQTGSKHEFRFTAPIAGQWILVVADATCCGTEPWGYELTAYIQLHTTVRVNIPRVVGARRSLNINGTVSGVTGGSVVVTVTAKHWNKHTIRPISSSGGFSWKPKVGKHGTYKVKVVYPGDTTHQGSSKTVKVRVI
jgi:hypothetical protein